MVEVLSSSKVEIAKLSDSNAALKCSFVNFVSFVVKKLLQDTYA